MTRRISGPTFGLLFCAWVLSAVVGGAMMLANCYVLVLPEGAIQLADDEPRTPPKQSTAAMWSILGFAMVVWPLPFCLGDRSRSVDGFGRE